MIRNNLIFPLILSGLFLCSGLLLLLNYYEYPIIRNSLIYAAIIQGISDSNLWQAADYAQNKPLGFAILSWPLSQALGVNLGLKIASWIGTALFTMVAILFLRHLNLSSQHKEIPQGDINLAIILCLFNPLLLYQFISAYPDTLFATLFLASLLCFDRALVERRHFLFVIFAFTLSLIAFWIKHHGYIIPILFLLMAYMRREFLIEQWQNRNRQIKFTIIGFLILLAVINDIYQGDIPLFNSGQNSQNFFSGENRFLIIVNNLQNFGIFLIVSFGFLTPLLLNPLAYKKQHYLILLLLGVFVLPILFYKGAQYNIRYFIALLPIFAWIIAQQLLVRPKKIRILALILFVCGNAYSMLYFNHVGFNQQFREILPLPKIDNLRLVNEQFQEKQNLQLIRRLRRDYNNTLVYLSDYYLEGTFGVWQKAGLLPIDLTIYNFSQWDNRYLNQYAVNKSIIYEYIGVGKSINPMPNDPSITPYLSKINKQLYLFDFNRKL